jgi:beta-N-acetylhexosaminidase
MDGYRLKNIFELYNRCYPNYQTSYEAFVDALKPESAHIIEVYEGESLVAFSMIDGKAIVLLCVDEKYRCQGYGSRLLAQSEDYLCKSGTERIILGRGQHYLLQGVPMDDGNDGAVSFFRKRGYEAKDESVNMRLALADFTKEKLEIPPKPPEVVFRFADYGNEAEKEALLAAVRETESDWLGYFADCDSPVMIATQNDRIVGMQILEPEGALFLPRSGETQHYVDRNRIASPDRRDSAIGCVGVIPSARQQGIGLAMVAEGAEWLKKQGCSAVELLFVGIADWYSKVGFVPTSRQWMGEKQLA